MVAATSSYMIVSTFLSLIRSFSPSSPSCPPPSPPPSSAFSAPFSVPLDSPSYFTSISASVQYIIIGMTPYLFLSHFSVSTFFFTSFLCFLFLFFLLPLSFPSSFPLLPTPYFLPPSSFALRHLPFPLSHFPLPPFSFLLSPFSFLPPPSSFIYKQEVLCGIMGGIICDRSRSFFRGSNSPQLAG